jgi:hypothetical protein
MALFQIPLDATVRVSLDMNLWMILERGCDLQNMKVWHHDPLVILNKEEITCFQNAALEVKLELKGDNMVPPKWVTELQNLGLLNEVHKFSKFIYGCAVLLPKDVRSIPYWVDNASVRDSIIALGGEHILVSETKGVGPGANQIYTRLLPFGDMTQGRKDMAVGRMATSKAASEGFPGATALGNNYGVNFYSEDGDDPLAYGTDMDEEAIPIMGCSHISPKA